MLDEGLEMLTLLWRDEPFSFAGKHYEARPAHIMIPPAPAQRPRIPIWVVGMWPAQRSMRRAARWDGWLPYFRTDGDGVNRPDQARLADGVAWLLAERVSRGLNLDGYDVVMEGTTKPGEQGAAEVAEWAEAGATWWLEADWSLDPEQVVDACRERLRAGPPRS
jgi:alkanesulfonate monooxygenase SsuD/methylene tetrahydromethanopterin reductase-like flavin-dependent oxidoreductase (luciferase family)